MKVKEFKEKMMKLKTRGPRTLPKPSKAFKSKKTYKRMNNKKLLTSNE